MRLTETTPPTVEPVSLEEAKLYLRVNAGDENALITSLIKAARVMVEKETHRALITQHWDMILDSAPDEIYIPNPPLQSIVEIKVTDADGAETTVSTDNYDVDSGGNSRGRVKASTAWPAHRNFASFTINFKAGYGDAPTNVPDILLTGVKLTLANLYENREMTPISVRFPENIRLLLSSYKIWEL